MPHTHSGPLDGDDGPSTIDEGASRPSWWSLLATVAVAMAAVLALALAVVVGGQLREDLPRAKPGEVIAGPFQADPPSTAGTVFLPWRQMSLAVGTPKEELPEVLRDRALVVPPEDGGFVRVDLRPARPDRGQTTFISRGGPSQAQAEVVLTADGKDYPLDDLGVSAAAPQPAGAFSRWVAVEGHPDDIEVTITVDGQEQTVDTHGDVERGKAGGLADLPSAQDLSEKEPSTCGTPDQRESSTVRIAHSDLPQCSLVGSLRTPFVDGLGWAAKGKEYLVVQASTDDGVDIPHEGDAPFTTTTSATARSGSTRPEPGSDEVGGSYLASSPGINVHQYVFEVPAGEPADDLTLRLDAKATPRDPFAPMAPERVRLDWTISGQELA